MSRIALLIGALTALWLGPGLHAQAQSVTIVSLAPDSGAVGTQITLKGQGFAPDNTVVFGSGYIHHVPSSDGVTLSFKVRGSQDPECFDQGCRVSSRPTMYSSNVPRSMMLKMLTLACSDARR